MATKDQIWTAADAISAEGGNPTLAAVRAHLGGGSYTDISAAMQAWRSHQQASATPIREPVPAALDERLNAFGGEVWAVALELANSRLQSERAALEQAQQEAEETRKEAAALADSLAAELDKVQADLAIQTEHLAACFAKEQQQQAAIDQANATAAAATHRAELAEAARGELQIRAEQISGLLKEEQTARQQALDDNRALSQQLAASTAKQERLQGFIDQAHAATAEANHRAELAETAQRAALSEVEKAQGEIKALSGQLADSADKLAQQQAAIEQANATAAAAAHRAELVEAARAGLQVRVDQIDALLKEEQAARAQLQGLLDKLMENFGGEARKPGGAKKQ